MRVSKDIMVVFLLLLSGLIIYSCTPTQIKPERDTPVSGKITVTVDETFGPAIQEEKMVFESIYDSAIINIKEKPEAEAIEDLINDSTRVIVIPRKLTEEELSHFKKKGLIPQRTFIAYDALAFIVNNHNSDTAITKTQLENILSGKIEKWKQLNSNSKLGDIQIVFDNNKSGTVRYVRDSILKGKQLSQNSSALNTNREVMNYVAANENAMGIIGVNRISNTEDSSVQTFLNTFKVVSVSSKSDSLTFVKPLQVEVLRNNYPFIREIYMISRETYMGLGTGFVSFVAGDRGQVIISRAGLYPARKSVRMIEVKTKFD